MGRRDTESPRAQEVDILEGGLSQRARVPSPSPEAENDEPGVLLRCSLRERRAESPERMLPLPREATEPPEETDRPPAATLQASPMPRGMGELAQASDVAGGSQIPLHSMTMLNVTSSVPVHSIVEQDQFGHQVVESVWQGGLRMITVEPPEMESAEPSSPGPGRFQWCHDTDGLKPTLEVTDLASSEYWHSSTPIRAGEGPSSEADQHDQLGSKELPPVEPVPAEAVEYVLHKHLDQQLSPDGSNPDSQITVASSSDVKGLAPKRLAPEGDEIYHEKQRKALCGVHAVNNLLQGAFFDEDSFKIVAEKLDQEEARLLGGTGLDRTGNGLREGWFNVQVMQAALGWASYEMEAIRGREGLGVDYDTLREQVEAETAFILNRNRHWLTIRRIGREWFDLDSRLKVPQHFTEAELRRRIGIAVREGFSVFVVRGDFKGSGPEAEPRNLALCEAGGKPRYFTGAFDFQDFRDLGAKEIVAATAKTTCFIGYAFLTHWFSAAKFHHRAINRSRSSVSQTMAAGCRRVREALAPNSGAQEAPPAAKSDKFDLDEVRELKLEEVHSRSTSHRRRTQRWSLQCTRLLRRLQYYPIFLLCLTCLSIAIWVAAAVSDGGDLVNDKAGLESLLPSLTLLQLHDEDGRDSRLELWRYISYQFTHLNPTQMILELLLLLVSGVPVESFFGTRMAILIHTIGITSGGVGHMVVNPHCSGLCGGLGGGCCFLGMHIADLLMNFSRTEAKKLSMAMIVLMSFLVFAQLSAAPDRELVTTSVGFATPAAGVIAGLGVGAWFCQGPTGWRGYLPRSVVVFTVLAGFAWACAEMSRWPAQAFGDTMGWTWSRQAFAPTIFGNDAYHCIRCADEACVSAWKRLGNCKIQWVDFRICDQTIGWWDGAPS